jgi:hypothetical protein
MALGSTVLLGCGANRHVELANKALNCVAIHAPGSTTLVAFRRGDQGKSPAFLYKPVRTPGSPPVSPEEELSVAWRDGETVAANSYGSAQEAVEALAYPAIRGETPQRYGTVTTQWNKPPTAAQRSLLQSCGL